MNNIKAYLTIDDGPSSCMKKKVDLLFKNNIPAIWFCIGKRMLENPANILYAISKGFIIGNHSFDHPNFSKLTFNESRYQIESTDRIIDSLYQKAGIKRPVKLFRFPCFIKPDGNEVQLFLKKIGYSCFTKQNDRKTGNVDNMYIFDVMEYRTFLMDEQYPPMNKKQIVERINEYFCNDTLRDDQIIVIHDHKETNSLFEEIIEYFLSMNIKFTSIL